MDLALNSGVRFRHPRAFWLGVAAVIAGVFLHAPMFLGARGEGYLLQGMGWDRWMVLGMALVVGGLIAVVYGIGLRLEGPKRSSAADHEFSALDSSRLSPAHIKLMLVMIIAIAIDTQKPFTFTFILPGVADEYDLASPSRSAPGQWPVALWPFVAISGTVIGSLVWGHLADRLGRRATILIIATMFMATSVCGAMPSLPWNLLMCFLMGFSVGGLLPIVYSLLTETMPVRRRGQMIVLVAGIGTALGFLFASWTANWLIPEFSWRIMWFFGVPTGLTLILLNRHIPESPRFLLAHGRRNEANAVMRSFGIVPSEKAADEPEPAAREAAPAAGHLYRRPYRGITLALVVFGLAWGLANFGFLVWLPTYVADSGLTADAVTAILAKAALFSVPGAILCAWLYGRVGSKSTLITAAALTAATLGVFAVLGDELPRHTQLFTAAVAALLVALWASVAVLAPYSAEVYPTAIRGVGSGVTAGATKLGGVFALGLSVAAIAPPAITGSAILAGVPAVLAAVMLVVFGIETRGRGLEEISAAVFAKRRSEAPALADGVKSS
jgi:putative MFS transporter